jgi:glucose/arabinose dehydrogenase
MPASLYHNGGGVAFDEDGMLLVSNGEEHDAGLAQDPAALGGKVYRFTPEGDVPPGGPFGDGPSLAIGLRNPYGLTIDASTGEAWVTENGPSSFDEINRIVPGGNYGWPGIWGPAAENPDIETDPADLESGSYQDPAIAYESIIVPTGIAFAGGNATDEFAGDLFFAAYGEGAIHQLGLNDGRDAVESDEIVHEAGEPVIALAWGPEGLYFSTADAIKVLPLAAGDDSSPSSAAGGGASPIAPSPSPSPARERDFGVGSVLTIAVLVALLLVFLGTRSRMKQASRD